MAITYRGVLTSIDLKNLVLPPSLGGPEGPTVIIAAPPTVNGPFTAIITFTKNVTGFNVSDLIIENGQASEFQSLGGSVYTALITPDGPGDIVLQIPAGVAFDTSSNGNVAANDLRIAFDTAPPSVVISDVPNDITGPFTATFTFTEDVCGFTIDDIVVGNGVASDLAAGYDFDSPTVQISGLPLEVNAPFTAMFTFNEDVCGFSLDDIVVGNGTASNFVAGYDLTAPSVLISDVPNECTEPFTATFTFSEPVTGFSIGDIILSNGNASDFQGEGTTYTALITPTAPGQVTIDVPAGVAVDAGGNNNEAAVQAVTNYNPAQLTVAISNVPALTKEPFTATFTFSEPVTGFDLVDILGSNIVPSNLAGSGSMYTALMTPTNQGPYTIDVAAGSAQSAALIGNTAAAQASGVFDSVEPSVAISGVPPTSTGPFTATFTFSEDVTGFELSDVYFGNANAAPLSGSGAVYTAVVTPIATGPVTVDIPAGVAADSAGNLNTVAAQASSDYTAPSSGATAITLTDLDDGRIFQRNAGTTNHILSVSGTYTGDDPASVQVRILLDSDDSVVVDWYTVDEAPSGNAWSGDITVPQGGAYYAECRVSDQIELTDAGTSTWFVGINLVLYGQSNMVGLYTTTGTPPAVNVGTGWFDGTTWGDPPNAEGIRNLLNTLQASTGIPCAALGGAVSGATIEGLTDGHADDLFGNLEAQIAANGGDFEFIVWHQGEGNSANSGFEYPEKLDILHGQLVGLTSRSKATAPLVLASLTTTIAPGVTDQQWDAVQIALYNATETYPNIHYSHSNMDAVRTDNWHLDAASQARAARRYAHTLLVLLGEETDLPHWFIASASRASATTTDVTVVHDMGTDFTPTSGITGFEVSDDNGSTWVSAIGARTDATTIQLTHSAVDASLERQVRYQYGTLPDVTAPVVDNGTLSSPLVSSAHQSIIAPGTAPLPVPTWAGSATAAVTGSEQTATGFDLGSPTTEETLIIAISQQATESTPVSSTLIPDVGADVVGALKAEHNAPGHSSGYIVYQFVVPAGVRTFDIKQTRGAALFSNGRYGVWAVETSRLASNEPIDHDADFALSAGVASVDISSSSDGFILSASSIDYYTGGTNSFSGDESFATRDTGTAGGTRGSFGDASGNSDATDTNTVTATWTETTRNVGMMAISYR